jgi:hypothetical protein
MGFIVGASNRALKPGCGLDIEPGIVRSGAACDNAVRTVGARINLAVFLNDGAAKVQGAYTCRIAARGSNEPFQIQRIIFSLGLPNSSGTAPDQSGSYAGVDYFFFGGPPPDASLGT